MSSYVFVALLTMSLSNFITASHNQAVVLYDENQFSHPFTEFQKRSKKFEFKTMLDRNEKRFEAEINQDWDRTGVAGVVWESAEILSNYFASNPKLIRGKTILELGAGTGLVSMVCKFLEAKEVIATDRESVLHALQSNVELNCPESSKCSDFVDVAVLDWVEPTLFDGNIEPDVIVGADLVYIEDLFPALIATLQVFASIETHIYFCSKMRYDRDYKFYELLRTHGFAVEILVAVSENAKAMSNIFDQSCLAIVTGTNRGLGKEIVHQLAKRITKPSCIVLISKSPETLKTNSESLRKQFPQHEFCTYACDLGIPSEVTDLISKLSEDLKAKVKQYEAAVLIQNAASLGRVDLTARDLDDMDHLQQYACLNLSSYIALHSMYLKLTSQQANLTKLIINISSLAASMPMPSTTDYCSYKAAREMALRVLDVENPDVRTLNYSPGPLESDMSEELKSKWTKKEATANWDYLTCEESVNRMMGILFENTFESATRIDYFDR